MQSLQPRQDWWALSYVLDFGTAGLIQQHRFQFPICPDKEILSALPNPIGIETTSEYSGEPYIGLLQLFPRILLTG